MLHVGPGKTGTKTVQWFGEHHEDLLKSNNFFYIRQERHELARLCRIKKQLENCRRKWDNFERLLDYHHTCKHITFWCLKRAFRRPKTNLESENKCVWDRLVPLQKRWRVRVVFTYCRFFEWVPSKYAQAYNPKGPNKSKRKKWPEEGGIEIPSFPAYFESKTKRAFKHPLTTKRRWDDHFENVQVFNLHTDGEFLVNFYCQMIPGATRACHYLSDEKYSSTAKNPSSKKLLHFDMIAVAAYKMGLVNKTVSRESVREAVGGYSKHLGFETVADFPLECLSRNQTESLLYQSLLMESEMVPEYFSSPQGESELLSGFWNASESASFCSIDTDKVLDDEQWQNFFRNLDRIRSVK